MFDFLSNKFSSVFLRLTGQGTFSEKNIKQALGLTLQDFTDQMGMMGKIGLLSQTSMGSIAG